MTIQIALKMVIKKGTELDLQLAITTGLFFTNLDLIDTQAVHPGHKTGQGGLSCSTDSNQEEMTLGLSEDSGKEQ